MLNYKHTILARGTRYGLLGSPDGRSIIPASLWALDALKDHLVEACRIPAPPPDAARIMDYKVTIDERIPKESTIIFHYFIDSLTGIQIYVSFDQATGLWFLREFRDSPGVYHKEGFLGVYSELPPDWGFREGAA